MKFYQTLVPAILASLLLLGCEAKKPVVDAATAAVPVAPQAKPVLADPVSAAPVTPKKCTKDSMKASVDATCKTECGGVKGKKAKACLKQCTQKASQGHDCMAHCDSGVSQHHNCQAHCTTSPAGGMDKSCMQHCDGTSTAPHDCEKHCQNHKDSEASACAKHCAK